MYWAVCCEIRDILSDRVSDYASIPLDVPCEFYSLIYEMSHRYELAIIELKHESSSWWLSYRLHVYLFLYRAALTTFHARISTRNIRQFVW